MRYQGYVIFRERLRQGMRQKELCRGICAVSYLSKIESGRADPSEEIIRLLLSRLGLPIDAAMEEEAGKAEERGFELLMEGRMEELCALTRAPRFSGLLTTAAGLSLELLAALANGRKPLEAALEPCMDERQLALQRMLQNRAEEAALLYPSAYTRMAGGLSLYHRGSYSAAIEALQAGYELAAKEGAARLMLQCKTYIGNSYCNMQDLENMERHYAVARRLAEALGDQETLRAIGYNTASSLMEAGRFEEALGWFASLKAPDLMDLHKLAICCEKTGRKKQALTALDRAEGMGEAPIDLSLAKQLCALVRYRLEHPRYLKDEGYGRLLLACFDRCRRELPLGYAIFHLPWMLEWYKAARQYRKACELLEEFPNTCP